MADEAPLTHARGLRSLAIKNKHTLDDRVVFDEDLHIYFVDGVRYPTSVSGIVHQCFPSFDPTKCVEKYYNQWKADKKSRYYQFITYLENVLGLPSSVAQAEICANWSSSGKKASGDGTSTHLAIELDLNDESPGEHHLESPEFKQYQEWRKLHPTWVPYRTEWSVFDEPTLLCGQIDSLWQDKITKKFYMVDWKRVEKLEKTNNFGERGFAPMDKFHNTNLSHYTLQQNLYAWMLKQNYGIQVEEMYLLQLHPSIEEADEVELPFITREIELIMSARRAKVAAGEITTVQASAKRAREVDTSADEARATRNKALRSLYTRLLEELE
jgi:hypothetical protein